jgi:diguanylate cyclase (GGDEF)-like protein/excisionase family DNA binding protein
MIGRLSDLPRHLREQTATAIRERGPGLVHELAGHVTDASLLDTAGWQEFSAVLISMLAASVEQGEVDRRDGTLLTLARYSPPLSVRQIIHAAQRMERLALDELALHEQLGATSDSWPMVASSIRGGMLEIVAALAERESTRAPLRDGLTTLVSRPALDLALAQEVQRSLRHRHGLALILFDIDNMNVLNESHGFGAGDRLLERLGILARRFFRTHDWVARHGDDSIGVLLPETTLDQAANLAHRFREMVRDRLVLVDHKTDVQTTVTVSAAAVGTDLVQEDVDPDYVMTEADAALLRALMNGGNRVERVAILPTSVTIVGAATLLGTTPREVIRLLRHGVLRATRRGRHIHIEREQIEEYRRK